MARETQTRSLAPILAIAQSWIERCLVADASILTDQQLWTPSHIDEVRSAFTDHPDSGADDFITKLRRQMSRASGPAQRLTGEMLWALLLFPSNIRPSKKVKHIRELWSISGQELPTESPALAEEVLIGIGSGGPGFNNHRWRELAYLIDIAGSLKRKDELDRKRTVGDYDAFLQWIDTASSDRRRQFRHMLRFFAFPDRVERMSSNRDRRAIVEALKRGSHAETRHWSDSQLDEALLAARRELEARHPGAVLDFYEPPLNALWARRDVGDSDQEIVTSSDGAAVVREGGPPTSDARPPVNRIFYGPPGTGKTYLIKQMFRDYTDLPAATDEKTWLMGAVARFGWRPIIAAALADVRSARVPDLRDHRWIQAKALERRRTTNVQPTLWSYLQEHTPETVTTVNISRRRPPYVFSKDDSGRWGLVSDWRDVDEEAAAAHKLLKAGPVGTRDPVRRYRFVTFHPSFGYEDFIRGIRPVAGESDQPTQFQMVDGVFKQVCDEAHANPDKRYAIFIDEINRANIAKVFGELITLIEKDKRAVFSPEGRLIDGMEVQLPGGVGVDTIDPPFSVPRNLDIYGTMNTADRSIALLDVALRRRFEFIELEPDYAVLGREVEEVHLGRLLHRINARLAYLFDRDHRVGHAYLTGVQSLSDLRTVFRVQIIPLLQEYFFDDFSRVGMVLATSPQAPPLVEPVEASYKDIFSGTVPRGVRDTRTTYQLTSSNSWTAATFVGIYGHADPEEPDDDESAA